MTTTVFLLSAANVRFLTNAIHDSMDRLGESETVDDDARATVEELAMAVYGTSPTDVQEWFPGDDESESAHADLASAIRAYADAWNDTYPGVDDPMV